MLKTMSRQWPGAGFSLLLVAAMLGGALIGEVMPPAAAWLEGHVDATLLCLVSLLLFGVPGRRGAIGRSATQAGFLVLAVVLNFAVVPWLGYAIARLVLPGQPLLMLGLAIYFMAPCTDWFLGFTRLANGNVALGTALIPLNMAMQLLLYPAYLPLFAGQDVMVSAGMPWITLWQWFLLPLVVAVLLHQGLRRFLGDGRFQQVLRWADRLVPWVLAVLVLEIFSANITVIVSQAENFAFLLLGAMLFFAVTFLLGEAVSRRCALKYPEHVLLTMTLAARNAPLMLAVTMAVLPGQPLVYAAIVAGMLLEFPHLALLRHLLLGQKAHCGPAGPMGRATIPD
ncbi:MAG: hypothetical protein KER_01140 [Kerstersia gyiorum]